MIVIENLKKEFDTENGTLEVIKGVDLNIKKGEIFGIIGLSGAGKSTLVRCINRLEEPTSGKVIIDGEDITAMDENSLRNLRTEIGMIFQHFNLFDQETVFDNIAYPLRIKNMQKEDINERVNNLLKFIDLEDKRDEYPSTLSGGQKQRVAIARALASKPKIILSDEGTSALDPANTMAILEILKKAVKEFDLTIVMITHQMEVAKEICDRIAVMEDGKIIEENTVEELFKNPKTQRTKSFIEGLQKTSVDDFDYSKLEGLAVRLTFDSNTAKKPIVSQIIREYNVDMNIISGNINDLRESEVGFLNIEILGDPEHTKGAVEELQARGINVEVIEC